MAEFFAMGGYAVYVWPSYLLALVVLVGNVVAPIMHRRRLFAELARQERARRKA